MSERRVSPDVRVVRTREQLKKALFSLLREKSFHTIKVTEITARAHVNRVTFYDHYDSREGLLQELIDDKLDEYADIIEQSREANPSSPRESLRLPIERTIAHFLVHADFYRVMLLENGVPEFRNQLENRMKQSLLRTMTRTWIDPEIDPAFYVGWIAGGSVTVFTQWLSDGMKPPPGVLAEQLLRMSAATLRALRGEPVQSRS